MSEFMVSITLPLYFDEEFVTLVPKQRMMVDNLMAENVVRAYTLSLDRTKLWIIIEANSEEEVVKTLKTFPLIDWMNYQIDGLAFHMQNFPVPAMSLN